MEWRDQGVILSVRKHGETSVIIDVFTREHGRHLGVVRGGTGRKMRPILQPGNQVDVVWKARLENHMGSFVVEPVRGRMGVVLGDALRLSALGSACAVASFALPERDVLCAFSAETEALMDAICSGEGWLVSYMKWELRLLEEAGFALDLEACAVTGGANDLAYVSPKTGRAVGRSAAGEWANRLLPLPEVLLGGRADVEGICAALAVTGHFLENHLAASLGTRRIPAARARFLEQLRRA